MESFYRWSLKVLYLPCLVAIWRLSRAESAYCYKMMLVMGVLDMLCLPICGLATGLLGAVGAVYCSWPGPIYVLGAMSFGTKKIVYLLI
jgi:hypothetical protein